AARPAAKRAWPVWEFRDRRVRNLDDRVAAIRARGDWGVACADSAGAASAARSRSTATRDTRTRRNERATARCKARSQAVRWIGCGQRPVVRDPAARNSRTDRTE